jgi:chemotaxis protein MotB
MFNRRRRYYKKDHGGINFWLSTSDLLSGMLFLFLLLLLFFSLQFKKKERYLTSQVQQLTAPNMARGTLLLDLQKMLEREGIHVEVLPTEGILRLTESTLAFEEAKALPAAAHLKNLTILAKVLKKTLPCMSQSNSAPKIPQDPQAYPCPFDDDQKNSLDTLLIEGHTDAIPLKAKAEYIDNLSLSAARATTVLRLLMQCEEELGQLHNRKGEPILAASGYSSLRPLKGVSPVDPRNRRIDIRFLMDVNEN